jgi:hypothetical protein
MTENKSEVFEETKICWMCRRTEEESLRDFKNIILEDNTESKILGHHPAIYKRYY